MYDYDRSRTKTAASWGNAIDIFKKKLETMVARRQQDVFKGMVGDVTKLFEDMAKSLDGYEFQKGHTARGVAEKFIQYVFDGMDQQAFDDWSVGNFFSQGYSGLEPAAIDLGAAQQAMTKALEGVMRKHKVRGEIKPKKSMFKDQFILSAPLLGDQGDNHDVSLKLMDAYVIEGKKAVLDWAKKNKAAIPSIRDMPDRGWNVYDLEVGF
jgi:hypothetical protein